MRVGDVSPLLTAYPALEVLRVRGGDGPSLPPGAARAAARAGGRERRAARRRSSARCSARDLPALDHLDLWLGTADYGGDSEVADLDAVAGRRAGCPRLRRLGLRNGEIADDGGRRAGRRAGGGPAGAARPVAWACSPTTGAAALLAGQPLTHLAALDLHHHYLSEELPRRLVAALPGVEVDLCRAAGAGRGRRGVLPLTAVSE